MKTLAKIVGWLMVSIAVLAILIAFPWLWIVVLIVVGMVLIGVEFDN